jgi:hypothetical protein
MYAFLDAAKGVAEFSYPRTFGEVVGNCHDSKGGRRKGEGGKVFMVFV